MCFRILFSPALRFEWNLGLIETHDIAYLKNVYVIVTSSAWRNVKEMTPVWPDFYKLSF